MLTASSIPMLQRSRLGKFGQGDKRAFSLKAAWIGRCEPAIEALNAKAVATANQVNFALS